MIGPTIFIYTPVANTTIICPSGNIYASDPYNLIYDPVASDVAFLVEIGCVTLNQRNNVAAGDPGATNDFTELYGVGSLWYNTGTSVLWICIAVGTTPGNAVWAVGGGGTTIGITTTITGSETIGPLITTVYVDNIATAPITVVLESTYSIGTIVSFIDVANNWGTYPLTITPSSGTIRSLASFAEVQSGAKDSFTFDGTNWW